MIDGILYSLTTGEIEANFRVQDELVGMVAGPGQGFLEAAPDVTYLTHYVSGGMLVAYNAAQRFTKANRPPYTAEWSNTLMVWVDQRTLLDAKAAKGNEINAARRAAVNGLFMWRGHEISHDAEARVNIDGINAYILAAGSFPPGWPGYWKAEDNTLVPLTTLADWQDFLAARTARGTAIFAHSEQLKAQVSAAQTIAEVDAVTWAL